MWSGLSWEAKLSTSDKYLVNALGDYVYYLAILSIWVFNTFLFDYINSSLNSLKTFTLCMFIPRLQGVMGLVKFLSFVNISFDPNCIMRMRFYRTDMTIFLYVDLILRIRKHYQYLGKLLFFKIVLMLYCPKNLGNPRKTWRKFS